MPLDGRTPHSYAAQAASIACAELTRIREKFWGKWYVHSSLLRLLQRLERKAAQADAKGRDDDASGYWSTSAAIALAELERIRRTLPGSLAIRSSKIRDIEKLQAKSSRRKGHKEPPRKKEPVVDPVHHMFSGDWYLHEYPDVAEAGMDPLRHYQSHGKFEGRNPHPFFHTRWYLELYPDVAACGMDPFHHYLTVGIKEGRTPHPLFQQRPSFTGHLIRPADTAMAPRPPEATGSDGDAEKSASGPPRSIDGNPPIACRPQYLVGLCMLQDEADIVEYFVRANLRVLDHLVIILNPSIDGTVEILDALLHEGLPITVWRQPVNFYDQEAVLTRVAQHVQDVLAPEHLLALDADEILLVPDKAALLRALSAIPAGHIGSIPWRTHIPPRSDLPEGFDWTAWHECLNAELVQFYKIVIPMSGFDMLKHRIENGSHCLLYEDGDPVPQTVCPGVQIAHLPVRSRFQFSLKVLANRTAKLITHRVTRNGHKGVFKTTAKYRSTDNLLYTSFIDDMMAGGTNADLRNIAATFTLIEKVLPPDAQFLGDAPLPPVHGISYSHLRKPLPAEVQLAHRMLTTLVPIAPAFKIPGAAPSAAAAASPAALQGLSATDARYEQLQCDWCDWPPLEYAFNRFKPGSVLELGCGTGACLSVFKSMGAEVSGEDGAAHGGHHRIARDEYQTRDLSIADTSGHDRNFDLGICLDVVGYLPVDAGLGIVRRLAQCCRKAIIFSAGQPGDDTLALMQPAFWMQEFGRHGWSIDAAASYSLKLLSTFPSRKRSIFCLRPSAELASPINHGHLGDLFSISTLTAPAPAWSACNHLLSFPGTAPAIALRRPGVLNPVTPEDRLGADPGSRVLAAQDGRVYPSTNFVTSANVVTLDFIQSTQCRSIAELGIYEGLTSSGFARYLDGSGELHLFDFEDRALQVRDSLRAEGHENVFIHPNTYKTYDSYNWSLMRILEKASAPVFDYVFIDGAHTWFTDALAFHLIDRLLVPGGYLDFDDYPWTMANSPTFKPSANPLTDKLYTPEQIETPQIQLVVDLLVKRSRRYREIIPNKIYQKLWSDV